MSRSDEYEPFLVGRRFRVAPPGVAVTLDGRLHLTVARGAFGSGEHETTASCLELLEGLGDLRGTTVLDVGAGTGILAIAALALGAERAVLVDVDADAVATSRRHVERNGVEERATVLRGGPEVAGDETFDLVCANIHGDILLRLAEPLVERTAPGGRLVLSGIAWEHNWDVRQKYGTLGCACEKNRFLEDYSTVLLRRSSSERT